MFSLKPSCMRQISTFRTGQGRTERQAERQKVWFEVHINGKNVIADSQNRSIDIRYCGR